MLASELALCRAKKTDARRPGINGAGKDWRNASGQLACGLLLELVRRKMQHSHKSDNCPQTSGGAEMLLAIKTAKS
jgi:hypothetical protein